MNRTLVLTQKYYEGLVPAINELTELDQEIIDTISKTPERVERAIRSFRFRDALSEAMKLAEQAINT